MDVEELNMASRLRKCLAVQAALMIVCSLFAIASASELYKAAEAGDIARVKALIREGQDVNGKVKEQDNATPLHIAVFGGHTEVVGVLIAAGADLEALDTKGFSPLHYGALRGHTDAVLALLGSGASTDSVGEKKRSTALFQAVYWGHADIVACLIAADASIDWQSSHAESLIVVAHEQLEQGDRSKQHKRVFALLLAAGATVPNELQKYAASPEMVAEEKKAKTMLAATRNDLAAARKKYEQTAKRPADIGGQLPRCVLPDVALAALILLGALVLAIILRAYMRWRKGSVPPGNPD